MNIKKLHKKLIDKKLTISIAESCTGGLLANNLTKLANSSKYFQMGLITYSNEAKIKILKVDIEGGEFVFEKDIYDFVNLNKLYCILSYHHMVFNRNKIKKNFLKMRTLFYQLMVQKIYPTKNKFKIASIFRG